LPGVNTISLEEELGWILKASERRALLTNAKVFQGLPQQIAHQGWQGQKKDQRLEAPEKS